MQSTILFVALSLPMMADAASSSLRFVPSGSSTSAYHRVVPLPNGKVLIVGGYGFDKCNLVTSAPPPFFFPICGQGQFPSVEILDSSGNPAGNSLAFGGGTGTVVDAAVDPSGNIWIAGETTLTISRSSTLFSRRRLHIKPPASWQSWTPSCFRHF
jgi:hypothetical protein